MWTVLTAHNKKTIYSSDSRWTLVLFDKVNNISRFKTYTTFHVLLQFNKFFEKIYLESFLFLHSKIY